MDKKPIRYYAMIEGERKGPFPLEGLPEAGVRPSTYVWCAGMDDWEKAEDVADICRFYRGRILDLMHPGSVEAQRRREAEAQTPAPPPAAEPLQSPTAFDRYMPEGEHIPTLEEIENQKADEEDIKIRRRSDRKMMVIAILIILLFPPTGIVALYYAHKTNKAEAAGAEKEAKDASRSAFMWIGITLCLGLVMLATVIRYVV